jgi:hypothetical protein
MLGGFDFEGCLRHIERIQRDISSLRSLVEDTSKLEPQGDHGSKKTTPNTGSPFETMLSGFINSSRLCGRNPVGANGRTVQAYMWIGDSSIGAQHSLNYNVVS